MCVYRLLLRLIVRTLKSFQQLLDRSRTPTRGTMLLLLLLLLRLELGLDRRIISCLLLLYLLLQLLYLFVLFFVFLVLLSRSHDFVDYQTQCRHVRVRSTVTG
jgi:hypothetical protein